MIDRRNFSGSRSPWSQSIVQCAGPALKVSSVALLLGLPGQWKETWSRSETLGYTISTQNDDWYKEYRNIVLFQPRTVQTGVQHKNLQSVLPTLDDSIKDEAISHCIVGSELKVWTRIARYHHKTVSKHVFNQFWQYDKGNWVGRFVQ